MMRFNDTDKMGKRCNGAYCTVRFLFYAILCNFLWHCDVDIALWRLCSLGCKFLTQYQVGKYKSKAINNDTTTTSLNIIVTSLLLPLKRYFPVMFY